MVFCFFFFPPSSGVTDLNTMSSLIFNMCGSGGSRRRDQTRAAHIVKTLGYRQFAVAVKASMRRDVYSRDARSLVRSSSRRLNNRQGLNHRQEARLRRLSGFSDPNVLAASVTNGSRRCCHLPLMSPFSLCQPSPYCIVPYVNLHNCSFKIFFFFPLSLPLSLSLSFWRQNRPPR